MASFAADAAYLIQLGAAAFLSLGRTGGRVLRRYAVFGVNFLILPIDPVLMEITNDTIHLLNRTYSIDLAVNFYFGVLSSLVLIIVRAVVTKHVVEPRLGKYRGEVTAESGGLALDRQDRPASCARSRG